MANEEHLKILKQGVEVWNKWREEHTQIFRDLRGADLMRADLMGAERGGAYLIIPDLRGADLMGANLSEANLSEANLCEADLRGADLRGTDLRVANLSEANLSDADLSTTNLGGAIIDEFTHLDKTEGVQKGVNGIYSDGTRTAALMTLMPRGNSMLGSNPDAVIESLKRSRSLHSYSLSLAGIGLLIAILGLDQIKLPFLTDISVSSIRYTLLAMPISLGILNLVSFFKEDALNGVRYVQDQKSAMAVGNFPWILSKFVSGSIKKIQSFITRFLMTFHPLVYSFFFLRWNESNNFVGGKPQDHLLTNFWVQLISVVVFFLLILICIRIFILSQGFQKPILFDTKTEKERKTDIEKLTIAVENQTTKIENLIDLIKPKKAKELTKRTRGNLNVRK